MESEVGVIVVVVAYGAPDLLARALQPLDDLEVIVVDNSSSSEVAGVARSAHYYDAGGNLGFAGGVNKALKSLACDSRDVLLLNPDAVVTRRQVSHLHARLRSDPGLAAVSPRLVSADGRPQRAMWPFPEPGRLWREVIGKASGADDWLVGACLLLKREALDAVGEFDERYFLYQEETDWQRRAVLQSWRVELVEDVVVEHVGGGTSGDPARRCGQFHAGAETYIRRWHGTRGWMSYRTAAVLGALVRGLLLRGEAGAEARARATLYLRGPRRVALANQWIPF